MTTRQIPQFSKKEIEDLLRKGAYAAIMDENDEGSRFCEEDIDQILQRRTKTITIESEGRGSTFAKVRPRTRTRGPHPLPRLSGRTWLRLLSRLLLELFRCRIISIGNDSHTA